MSIEVADHEGGRARMALEIVHRDLSYGRHCIPRHLRFDHFEASLYKTLSSPLNAKVVVSAL